MREVCDPDVLVVLVGNKCDLDEHYISFDDMSQKAEDLGIKHFFETSAIPDRKDTIEQLFSEIAFCLCDQNVAPKRPSVRLENPRWQPDTKKRLFY